MAEAGPILDSRQRATVQILGSWCGTVGLWDLVNSRRGVSLYTNGTVELHDWQALVLTGGYGTTVAGESNFRKESKQAGRQAGESGGILSGLSWHCR